MGTSRNHKLYLPGLGARECSYVPDNKKKIKDICNKDIKIELVRKVKTPADLTGMSALVKFNRYEDKEFFVRKLQASQLNIRHRDIDWDPDNFTYEKVHTIFL